jgi:predicted  nucleic acid-binding Zn-ribbon protein
MTQTPTAADRPIVDDVAYQTLEHLRALRSELRELSNQMARVESRLTVIETRMNDARRKED